MKKYLENLKKELKKRNFSKEDIEEILADHQEMIATAQDQGLTDDEIVTKFGDPEQLASDLQASKPLEVHTGGGTIEGYELLSTFPVLDAAFDVNIALVNEDIKVLIHDQDQIEVHGKHIKDAEDYDIAFDGKEFLLKRNTKMRLFSRSSDSRKLIVKLPQNVVSKRYSVKLVSGDAKVEGAHSDEFELNTTSGDVTASNLTAGTAKVHAVSGDIGIQSGELQSLELSLVSGDCKLHSTTVSGDFRCNTVSGDLKAEQSECNEFSFHTVSGDCKGTDFYPKSVSLRSVSGDIKIKNSDKTRQITIVKQKALSGKVKIN